MICRENDVVTLRNALSGMGLLDRVSIPEGIDLDNELVRVSGPSNPLASKDAEDKGRLFCYCGSSLALFALSRVGGKPGSRFLLNSSFDIVLELRPVPTAWKGTDTYLALVVAG